MSKYLTIRRRSNQVEYATVDKKANTLPALPKRKFSSGEQPNASATASDIDAQMKRIKEQLSGLKLQRTSIQKGIEEMGTNLSDIRGEYAARVSLNGSISDLSSLGSFASIFSDRSSVSSSLSQCYLIEESDECISCCENDVYEQDTDTDCSSSGSTPSSITTLAPETPVEQKELATTSQTTELFNVTEVTYL